MDSRNSDVVIDGLDYVLLELPNELVSNELIYRAIKICEESALSLEEREAYHHAEEEVIWQNSIKGLEDEVVENRKSLVEKDKEIEELKKQLRK